MILTRSPLSSRINFADATDADIQHLAESCEPATFGLDREDVLDETYRKAGKMDESDFAAKFDPERTGLLDAVRPFLLEGHRDTFVRAELYKLNVYGKGLAWSFAPGRIDAHRLRHRSWVVLQGA